MPRLFWKLFLALWLSIMTFAVVVSWINQTVIQQHSVAEPVTAYGDNLRHLQARLTRELNQGGEERVKRALHNLPRGIRNRVFVLDPDKKELLGRDRVLNKLRRSRATFGLKQVTDRNGRTYTLISAGRTPPRALLEPGPRGIGLRLAVAAVISALISMLLARYLAAPLRQLSRVGRQLATGDLSVRVGAALGERRDEFGQLALDLDEMASRLQTAQQANRRLLRDVSHELRSPLARLAVALEIARNKDSDTLAQELNRIELESQRLETLVDEVLGLLRESSGSQQLQLQRFDLAEMLQDLVETVNYEVTEQREHVSLNVTSALIMEGDREQLWRAFENLLRNALVHAGTKGDIEVSAELCTAKEDAPGKVDVRVKDSGPGIAEVHLGRIFEPFYRVDEARTRQTGARFDGHGLGLAIAASAVRRHGGSISASNRRGGGLEVQVILSVNPQIVSESPGGYGVPH